MDPSFVLSLFLGVSGVGGGVFAYVSKRFDSMDARLDSLETTLHKDFVRKDELVTMIDRLEQQVQRIDEKLDRILLNGRHLSS
jgi:Tfp pilus assembly protein PilO